MKLHLRAMHLPRLVNIHDDAITFEPIHKVIFDTEAEMFFCRGKGLFADNIGEGRALILSPARSSSGLIYPALRSASLSENARTSARHTQSVTADISTISTATASALKCRSASAAQAFSCRAWKIGAVFIRHEKRSVPKKAFPSAMATISAIISSAAKSGNLPL